MRRFLRHRSSVRLRVQDPALLGTLQHARLVDDVDTEHGERVHFKHVTDCVLSAATQHY